MFRICSHLRNDDRELGYTKGIQLMYNLSVNSYLLGNYFVNKLKKYFYKKRRILEEKLEGCRITTKTKIKGGVTPL